MSLYPVLSEGVDVTLKCLSGDPACGAKVPHSDTDMHDAETVEVWAEYHYRITGHALFARAVQDTVQYRPPEGTAS
ncbi:hypothetical protein ACWEV4_21060 [Streptomyces sp. NPDC003860]